MVMEKTIPSCAVSVVRYFLSQSPIDIRGGWGAHADRHPCVLST